MIRRLLRCLGLAVLAGSVACAQNVTLTGTLQGASGLKAQNYTLALQPSQLFFVAGTALVVNTTVFCGTSTDGTVVSIVKPLTPMVTAVAYTGTLPAATYYIEYAWYDSLGHVTLPSSEQTLQLTATGQLQLSPPTQGVPAAAVGMNVYIGSSSGTETLQGQTVGTATFVQSVPLVTGAALPTSNTTVCSVVANDAGWPTGTGYNVTFTDPSGNVSPGYPQMWRFLGPGSTYNLSNGLPSYNGLVTYPVPIHAVPYNHNPQSISGPLDLTNYNLTDVGRLGLGTAFPAWGVDAEGSGLNGAINANTGYLYNGTAPNLNVLMGNGSYFVPSATIPASIITGLFYQTVDANGTPVAQQPILNFDSTLTVTPNSGNTSVGMPSTGVTAGTYSFPNSLTVDAQGRIHAISSAAATACTSYASTSASGCMLTVDGKLYEWVTSLSQTANFAGSISTNWPVPFPTACYTVNFATSTPTPPTGNGSDYANYLVSCSTTSVTAYMDVGPDAVGTVSRSYIAFGIGQ